MKPILCFLMTLQTLMAADGVVEQLWPANKVPYSQGSEDKDIPTLTIYLPHGNAAGTGVVVCPGGGYGALAMDHEGKQIARWLNDRGIAAFVLKYRLGPKYHHPVELTDAQRAMHIVRSRAKEFGVQPDRIGIWGFSAGGHLASTVSTHFHEQADASIDPLSSVSSRPDFAILAYPVITFHDPYAHKGSRTNLLGKEPDPKLVDALSNETQVTKETPITFLFHTADDSGVPVENSLHYFEALRKNGVKAELHVYQTGNHGVGLADGQGNAPNIPVLATWAGRLEDWLRLNGLLPASGSR